MADKIDRVTLDMIAARAGVSIGTVDRALNNRDGINEETRKRVLEVADKLNYQPNKLAGVLGRKKKTRIGIVYPVFDRDFNAAIDKGVTDAANELFDFGVTVDKIRFELQSPEMAYEKLQSIDLSQYDGFAINSVGRAIEEAINGFVDSGVPVITFNTDFPNSSRLFYIGSDLQQAGMMAGEMLAILIGYTGKVAVLGDFTRLTPSIERFSGFCEFLQTHYPDIHIHACAKSYNDTKAMSKRLIDLVELIPDISGVFCTGYTSTIGALDALKALNRTDIQAIGFDITPKTIKSIRENHLKALIYQDPYKQGYSAVNMLSRHLLEGYLPEKSHVYVENRIVFRSNLDYYLGYSGR